MGMSMHKRGIIFHVPIALYAIVYAVGLQVLARYSAESLVVLASGVAAFAVISAVVGRIIARHFFFAIVPVILSVASLTLLFFIDSRSQQIIVSGIVGILVYGVTLGSYRLSRYPRDAVARGMVVAGATTAIFFSYAAIFAIYLNFIVPLWFVGFSIFILTTVISWQYFVMIAHGRFVQTIIYSCALGVVLSEVAVSAIMWPFGYLTTSVVLLMIYYILWDLGQSFFLERLSKTRLSVNVIFFLAMAALVLSSAQWLPVV